uniref:Putative secreted protein n=1 Tax=Anopheles marajoara TaxID=58244 RepID=A0A2M4C9Y7_9DIPT
MRLVSPIGTLTAIFSLLFCCQDGRTDRFRVFTPGNIGCIAGYWNFLVVQPFHVYFTYQTRSNAAVGGAWYPYIFGVDERLVARKLSISL